MTDEISSDEKFRKFTLGYEYHTDALVDKSSVEYPTFISEAQQALEHHFNQATNQHIFKLTQELGIDVDILNHYHEALVKADALLTKIKSLHQRVFQGGAFQYDSCKCGNLQYPCPTALVWETNPNWGQHDTR